MTTFTTEDREAAEPPSYECSVCSCDFVPEEEGGIIGEFGILPVQFCPTCLCSMLDMADQLRGEDEDDFDMDGRC
jgi:hypothetical protein